MPAEWTRHQACLILFPHNPRTYRLDQARKQVLNVAQAIASEGQETVYLLVKNEHDLATFREKYPSTDSNEEGPFQNVHWKICPSNDTWVRDTGPTCCYYFPTETTTKDQEGEIKGQDEHQKVLVGLDWDFNAYGGPELGCYWPYDLDQKVASTVCQDILKIPSYSIPLVLEGGSIHTDGDGTLLVTKECLLNPNRNPHLSQEVIEGVLKQSLGVEVVIWLPDGLDADDDTNGHVDNFCCFTEPGHVVLAWTDDEINDLPNYQRCRTALQVLESTRDAKGRCIQVHKLPLPSPPLRYSEDEVKDLNDGLDDLDQDMFGRKADQKMAASYVNFHTANKAVVVPQFGVPSDGEAIAVLQERFPNRKVIGVSSREILLGGGNIHCITQQIPIDPSRP